MISYLIFSIVSNTIINLIIVIMGFSTTVDHHMSITRTYVEKTREYVKNEDNTSYEDQVDFHMECINLINSDDENEPFTIIKTIAEYIFTDCSYTHNETNNVNLLTIREELSKHNIKATYKETYRDDGYTLDNVCFYCLSSVIGYFIITLSFTDRKHVMVGFTKEQSFDWFLVSYLCE